jgi:hypothetical protein
MESEIKRDINTLTIYHSVKQFLPAKIMFSEKTYVWFSITMCDHKHKDDVITKYTINGEDIMKTMENSYTCNFDSVTFSNNTVLDDNSIGYINIVNKDCIN